MFSKFAYSNIHESKEVVEEEPSVINRYDSEEELLSLSTQVHVKECVLYPDIRFLLLYFKIGRRSEKR